MKGLFYRIEGRAEILNLGKSGKKVITSSSWMTLVVKNLPEDAGDARNSDLIPALGRSPRVGNGNLIQCSCLENLMDGGA